MLVVTRRSADALGLTSMEQLKPHCPQLTLGAAGEWPGRWKDRIAAVYGCIFRQILSTDAAGPVTLEALRSCPRPSSPSSTGESPRTGRLRPDLAKEFVNGVP